MSFSTETLEANTVETVPERLRVLLVDDIPENLSLLEEVLGDAGYETVSVMSGAEALQHLRSDHVHLIVADAMMPAIDGFQLCKEVKQSPKLAHLPFVIYTGNYVDKEDHHFAKSIGVDAYVMKYDGLATLVQSVNTLAERAYGTRAGEQSESVGEPPIAARLNLDDQIFLERHHAIVVKKLEEKMHELEVYSETLSRKTREIQSSEARYRNLFEHASIGIFALEKQTGRVVDVNAEGLALLRYTREDLLAAESLAFVEEPDARQAILQSGAFFSKETTFRRRDGVLVDVELGAGPFDDGHNPRVILYVLDITEQRKMRQHMVQTEKMAFLGRLAASIAHDIRNPLSAIALNLQYLAKRLPEDFKDRTSLNFAIEGAQRISKVIENTLNLARVLPPKVQPEDVNEIVRTAARFLTTASAQKHVLLETQLAPDLPKVLIEAKQIEQVVLNLVQNAIDVAPEKSTITVSTCIMEDLIAKSPAAKHKVALVVLDRGPGIPTEVQKHLFEPFHTTKEGGTGLGLALSKQIMDKHNAEIRIEPAVGGGTIARLIFPLTLPGELAHG
jgi:PAS domain S-box-containing protein